MAGATGWRTGRGLLLPGCAAVVLGCVVYAAVTSLRWPLVGDAALMHYVVFLQGRGLVPYRDIVDINLPGTYLFEGLGMRLLGGGALAWRVYDLLLLVAAGWAMVLLDGRRQWAAGLLAAGMFALIHLQDGMAQTGQRDLLIAVLLLWSYVALFAALRVARHGAWLAGISAFLIGTTLTIKPAYLPLGLLLLLLVAGSGRMKAALFWLGGLLLPAAGFAAWLIRIGALRAFLAMARDLVPLHAAMGRKPLAYLLNHAFAPVMGLCGVWLLLWIVGWRDREQWRECLDDLRRKRERWALLAGIVVSLGAYIAQGKGYPYHRYPLLALLLVGMELDFYAAWQTRRKPLLLIGGIALAAQAAFYAPHAAWQVHSIRPIAPFETALSAELKQFGPGLSGNVQCLDTFGGCINTLYDLRLVQASGYLYDCYALGRPETAAVARYRRGFLQAYERHPPEVMVMTDQFCFGQDIGFARMAGWPAFAQELADHYTLQVEWHSSVPQHWFSRAETTPRFRIYRRRR